MGGQGQYFSEKQLRRITQLLSSTDMTIKEIAERMSCSRSIVASINRKFQLRLYCGKKTQWQTRLPGPVNETLQQRDGIPLGNGSAHDKCSSAAGRHEATADVSKSVA